MIKGELFLAMLRTYPGGAKALAKVLEKTPRTVFRWTIKGVDDVNEVDVREAFGLTTPIKRAPPRLNKITPVKHDRNFTYVHPKTAETRTAVSFRRFVRALFPEYPIYESVHGPIFDRLESHLRYVLEHRLDRRATKRFDLYMIPPGTCKTTIVCNAFPVWALGIEPNLRFLIFSEDIDVAAPKIDKCRQIIEDEEAYGKFFPGRRPQKATSGIAKEKWTQHAFTVGGRDEIHQEPSMMAAGFRNFPASFHYDFVLADDPHADQSIRVIDNVWKMTEKVYYRMEPWAAMVGICTTWREWDWSHRMREKWADRMTYKPYIRPLDNGTKTEAGLIKSLLPEFWSDEKATQERKHANEYDWACQMMLDPTRGGDRRFSPAVFDRAVVRIDSMAGIGTPIITCDLRGIRETELVGSAERGSEDAIYVGAWRQRGTAVGLDCCGGQWSEDEFLAHLRQKIIKWKPEILGIEDVVFTSWGRRVVGLMLSEMRIQGHKVPRIIPMKHGGRNKIERIRGWLSDFNKGYCEFSDQMEGLARFREQLITFPACRDGVMDWLDAWAYFLILSLDLNRVPGLTGIPDEVTRTDGSALSLAKNIRDYVEAQKRGVVWRAHRTETKEIEAWANG